MKEYWIEEKERWEKNLSYISNSSMPMLESCREICRTFSIRRLSKIFQFAGPGEWGISFAKALNAEVIIGDISKRVATLAKIKLKHPIIIVFPIVLELYHWLEKEEKKALLRLSALKEGRKILTKKDFSRKDITQLLECSKRVLECLLERSHHKEIFRKFINDFCGGKIDCKSKMEGDALCLVGGHKNLPFKDNSFDMILLYEIDVIIPNRKVAESISKELHRVCKKDGYVLYIPPPFIKDQTLVNALSGMFNEIELKKFEIKSYFARAGEVTVREDSVITTRKILAFKK